MSSNKGLDKNSSGLRLISNIKDKIARVDINDDDDVNISERKDSILELNKELSLGEAESMSKEELTIRMRELEDMSDDEAILELDKLYNDNDRVIERDFLSSVVRQNDNERFVYYEVENIYSNNEDRRFKNRLKLRNDPPILIVKDTDGNEVNFFLTEALTKDLSNTLKQVERAYLGFSGPESLDIPENLFDKIGYYAKNNPIKVLLPVVIIFAIVIKMVL